MKTDLLRDSSELICTGQVNGERWLVDRPCGWNAGLSCPLTPCGGLWDEVQVMSSRLVVTSAQGINTGLLQPYIGSNPASPQPAETCHMPFLVGKSQQGWHDITAGWPLRGGGGGYKK